MSLLQRPSFECTGGDQQKRRTQETSNCERTHFLPTSEAGHAIRLKASEDYAEDDVMTNTLVFFINAMNPTKNGTLRSYFFVRLRRYGRRLLECERL